MKKIILFLGIVLGANTFALEGFYLGGQVGAVGLGGAAAAAGYGSALGFGVNLGFRTNSRVDVLFEFQTSSHAAPGATLTQFPLNLVAQIHLFNANDFDFSVAAGPGIYIIRPGAISETDFGLQGAANIDLLVEEKLNLGVSFAYNALVNATAGGSFWTLMMRFGYLFPLG